MQVVSCTRCQSVVPQSETEFSSTGALLCRRCANIGYAHAQAERVFENAVRDSGATRSGNVVFVHENDYAKVKEAQRITTGLHADINDIAVRGQVAGAAMLECSRCGAIVPTKTTSYSLEGKPICRGCAATYDQRAERKKLEGTAATGFALAFFLSVVGFWIVSNRGKLAEIGAAKYGLVAGTILIYFPLLLTLWAMLG